MNKEIDLGTLHGVKLPAWMEWRKGGVWSERQVVMYRSEENMVTHVSLDGIAVNWESDKYRPIKETKKVPWELEDYIKAGHPALLRKGGGASIMPYQYGTNAVIWTVGRSSSNYEQVAKDYTLLDGTELYKEIEV